MKSALCTLFAIALSQAWLAAEEPKGFQELKQLHAAAWKAKSADAFRALYETKNSDAEILERTIKMTIENFTTFPNQSEEIVGSLTLAEMAEKIKSGAARTAKGADTTPALKATLEYATKGRQMGSKFVKPNLSIVGVLLTKGVTDASPEARKPIVMEGITPVGITKEGKLRIVLPQASFPPK